MRKLSIVDDAPAFSNPAVKKGDRIAQLVLESIVIAEVEEVAGDLDATDRGAGGFGSTGTSGPADAKRARTE